jgi:hypothetical protein
VDPVITGSLVGAAVVGVLSILATHLSQRHAERLLSEQHDFQRSEQRDQVLRARGEELYAMSEGLGKAVFIAHFPLYAVMRGEMSYSSFYGLFKENMASNTYDHNRFEMLVDVYFPTTRAAYDEMQNALRAHNDVVARHRLAYKEGKGSGGEFRKPFREADEAFQKAQNAFSRAVLTEIKKIGVVRA